MKKSSVSLKSGKAKNVSTKSSDHVEMEKYIKESIAEKYECEMVIKKEIISQFGFYRMKRYVEDNYDIVKTTKRESLDMRTIDTSDTLRLTITGKDDILDYCKTNSVPNQGVDIIRKSRVEQLPPILITDYDIKLNVNREDDVPAQDKSDYVNSLKNKYKFYRYKQRFSYTDKNKSMRIDMSIVRSSSNPKAKSLVSSKTLSSADEYEVEIEILNDTKSKPSDITKKLMDLTFTLLKLNLNVTKLIPKSKKDVLLYEYATLVDKSLELGIFNQNQTRYFIRYQPVTLMKRNLLDPDVDVVSIQEDYSVTEKADGERYVLYISKTSDVYFINSRMNVIDMDMKHPSAKSCLIDGEYITKGKLNTKLNMYMAFDCYFVNGVDVRNKDLIDRLDMIDKSVLKDWKIDGITIEVKKFFYNTSKKTIFEETKKCIDRALTLPYHTDGLVFTPLYLPPGALYKNDNTMNPYGGAWNKVFKWKPPEENTIDVLLKFGNESIVETNDGTKQRCMYADMFVAYKGSIESTVNIVDMYNMIQKNNINYFDEKNKVIKRVFDFTYLPIVEGNKFPLTKEGNEFINDNMIVEMAYVPNSSYTRWSPLRLRKDKTAVMKQTNTLDNAANYYNTAMNVWMSINDPIDKEMLIGTKKLDKDEVKTDNQDLYYARETPRDRSLLRPMLDFHNYWVKKKNLFDLFAEKNYRLLEVGCGQAGDLPKWIDNRFSQVVGIDNNEDNLLNSNSGAYRRMIDNISTMKLRSRFDLKKQSFVFLLMDGSVAWDPDEIIKNTSSDEFKYLASVAFGKINKSKILNKHLLNVHNAMNDPFDVISCQFAVHYFFKDNATLDIFCSNINKHMKRNGYFIGCCLDGHIVNQAFTKKKNDIIQGKMNDKVLWQIQKKYTDYDEKGSGEKNLGKQIDVYVETINKIIPEYLVDFELFQRKLEKFNITLVDTKKETNIDIKTNTSSGSFEVLWDNMVKAQKNGFKNWAVSNAIDSMTDVIKEYSFMNRWFIFKKG